MKKLGISILFLFFSLILTVNATWIIDSDFDLNLVFNKGFNKPVAYIIGKDKQYSTIEKALDSAVSGDIVTVFPGLKDNYHDVDNKVIPDSKEYEIKRNCEIKPGVTFLLPTDQKSLSTVNNATTLNTYIESMKIDDRSRGSNSSYASFATNNQSKYLRTTIKIKNNVTLINNGNLVVSGYLGSGTNNPGLVGQTSHSYAQILLEQNAKIIQNNDNSNLYCFGYIDETSNNNNSKVELSKGTLHIPFVINDYRGFHNSFAMTDGAINNMQCAPFNQFTFPNISSTLNVLYNSKIESYASIYAEYTNPAFKKVFPQSIHLLGNNNTFVLQFTDSQYSSLKYKFNKNTSIAKINFYGGLKLNNLAVKIKESIVTIDLNTKNAFFPISYHFDIELDAANGQNEAIFDTTLQRIKLMPGSKFTINKNAILNASEFTVYTSLHEGGQYNGYSSKFLGTIAYPLKEGAILKINGGRINANSLAGTIYGDSTLINYTTNNILTREPWQLGNSGSINPPWTITDYLEIYEEVQVRPLGDLQKEKIYGSTHIFSNYKANIPNYDIVLNDGRKFNVNKTQKVFILDNVPQTYKINLKSNIYKVFKNNTYYNKNELVPFTNQTKIITAINSTQSISDNNNGINEFNVQKIDVKCETPLIQGKIPLWPNSSINLKANVIDINKAYDKKISWSSSNNEIATVDQQGNVTGKQLGQVEITATCDGVEGKINLEVIEEIKTQNVESITITDDSGGSSEVIKDANGTKFNNEWKNNKNPVFKVNINPLGASYKSIKWTLNASSTGRQWIDDNTQATNIVEGVESLTVHIGSGTGKSDDYATLTCEVVGLDNVKHTAKFIIRHLADACVGANSLVAMSDGTYKQISDLNIYDTVISFNHETGKFEKTQILAIANHGFISGNKITLMFSDGSVLDIINQHELFDYTLRKYININESNYKEFINHEFVDYNIYTNSWKPKKLISVNVQESSFEAYTIKTYKNLNAIINDTLSSTPIKGLNNYFDYDTTLKYDKQSMINDIIKYGLYTYDDWKDRIPKFMFDGYGFKYFKVSIGKGLMTYEQVLSYIEDAYHYVETGEMIFNDKLELQ